MQCRRDIARAAAPRPQRAKPSGSRWIDSKPRSRGSRTGGVVAYPTETVWGLGADARSDAAVARLRAFKGRSDAAPISILVTGVDALAAAGLPRRRGRAAARARLLAGPADARAAVRGPLRGRARARGRRGRRALLAARGRERARRALRDARAPARSPRRAATRAARPPRARATRRAASCAAAIRARARRSPTARRRRRAGGEHAASTVDRRDRRRTRRVLRWGAIAETRSAPGARGARRMTEIRPFRALRYDPARVDLSRVIVPPYDVVAAEDRAGVLRARPAQRDPPRAHARRRRRGEHRLPPRARDARGLDRAAAC